MAQINELTQDQASKLLATFFKPCKSDGVYSGADWKGQFCSNSDYLDNPSVEGAYVHSGDGGVEITIGWNDVEGMNDESVAPFCGYSFPADNVRNWTQAAKATKDHLAAIVLEND